MVKCIAIRLDMVKCIAIRLDMVKFIYSVRYG